MSNVHHGPMQGRLPHPAEDDLLFSRGWKIGDDGRWTHPELSCERCALAGTPCRFFAVQLVSAARGGGIRLGQCVECKNGPKRGCSLAGKGRAKRLDWEVDKKGKGHWAVNSRGARQARNNNTRRADPAIAGPRRPLRRHPRSERLPTHSPHRPSRSRSPSSQDNPDIGWSGSQASDDSEMREVGREPIAASGSRSGRITLNFESNGHYDDEPDPHNEPDTDLLSPQNPHYDRDDQQTISEASENLREHEHGDQERSPGDDDPPFDPTPLDAPNSSTAKSRLSDTTLSLHDRQAMRALILDTIQPENLNSSGIKRYQQLLSLIDGTTSS